ncbi:GDSL-type esterase/lipase family protein [Hymenobacter sp. B1770]|uniref:GDSL-type esterase/lipase family protein n=1 Tax=Hymenobacter sp. B1770 TaxID=1718788 RepID=UPI003CFA9026
MLFEFFPALSHAQVRIMPIGNSITHGTKDYNSYRRALWHKLRAGGYRVDFVGSQSTNKDGFPAPNPDFDPDHEGHAGWKADELLQKIGGWAASYRPDVLLLHAGTNDIRMGQSPASTRSELGDIIDKVRQANPSVKVLLAKIIPTVSVAPYENDGIRQLNALLPDLAKQKNTAQSPVVIVDQYTGMSIVTDMYDGIHPNQVGEEKMAVRWYDALQQLLPPPNPLPVELVKFTARAVRTGVQLDWATATERNNASFTVERSATGTVFTDVGQVAGHGTSSSPRFYSMLDAQAPAEPLLYYRLRQTDLDGTATFSGVVSVVPLTNAALVLSPVPAENLLVVSGLLANDEITIWNASGQVVQRQPAAVAPVELDVSRLPGGLYFVRAGLQRARFIKL